VDLAKVNAENERLQQGHREEERRNRQSTYHQFLDSLILIYQLLGTEADQAERSEICEGYNHLLAGVLLFGSTSVRDGAHNVNAVYERIWLALRAQRDENPEKSPEDCWQDATADLRDDFSSRTSVLVRLMHEDVTRGITD
jgi:hypothetical protein